MRRFLMTAALMAALFGFVGCDPDEISVTMTTSAVERVMDGRPSTAKVTILFDSISESDNSKLQRCVSIARRYVGEDGSVVLSETETNSKKIVAKFKVPVVPADQDLSARSSLLKVVLSNGEILAVVPNESRLKELNEELEAVDSSLTIKLNGKKTKMQFVGTSDDAVTLGALAAKVDGDMALEARRKVNEGDTVTFEFEGGSGGDAPYSTVCPQVRVNPKTPMVPIYKAPRSARADW